jgi:hypothetical protein
MKIIPTKYELTYAMVVIQETGLETKLRQLNELQARLPYERRNEVGLVCDRIHIQLVLDAHKMLDSDVISCLDNLDYEAVKRILIEVPSKSRLALTIQEDGYGEFHVMSWDRYHDSFVVNPKLLVYSSHNGSVIFFPVEAEKEIGTIMRYDGNNGNSIQKIFENCRFSDLGVLDIEDIDGKVHSECVLPGDFIIKEPGEPVRVSKSIFDLHSTYNTLGGVPLRPDRLHDYETACRYS